MRVSAGIRKRLIPVSLFVLLACPLMASENGASVYPAGVETVMPGVTPDPGKSMICLFTAYYGANSLVDTKGRSIVPGFHLGVSVAGVRLEHNWGVRLLGGSLVSATAIPLVSQTVTTPAGTVRETGVSNIELRPVLVAYRKRAWFWWYGLDVFTPGIPYSRNAALNVGQHNWAIAPAGAISWLPNRGQTEIGSRFNYIVNRTNPDTNFRSGHEFTWEFVAMQNVARKVAVGVNGYYSTQTTDDLLNRTVYADGNRGRALGIGPEVRMHLGRTILIAKYLRDTLVHGRPVGNMFRLQWGIPLGGRE